MNIVDFINKVPSLYYNAEKDMFEKFGEGNFDLTCILKPEAVMTDRKDGRFVVRYRGLGIRVSADVEADHLTTPADVTRKALDTLNRPYGREEERERQDG